jgi:hypothetical protein
MALLYFVWPWPLFQLLNSTPIEVRLKNKGRPDNLTNIHLMPTFEFSDAGNVDLNFLYVSCTVQQTRLWLSWLRHCAENWNTVGSNAVKVIEIFI